MSLFNKLKYALGFSEPNDPDIEDDPDTVPVRRHEQPRVINDLPNRSAVPVGPGKSPTIDISEVSGPKPEMVFEHVVAIFNKSLPDFLASSVDPEAQKKFLYDSLTQDLKEYVDASRLAAEQQCRRHFENEKTKLQANIREMESRYREYDSMRNDMQQKLLSAERQKRAMAERVRDLEDKINTFEAEREQFQLENKSLVNKLKVSGVHEDEVKELQEELNNMRAEVNRLRAQGVQSKDAGVVADMQKEIDALRAKLKETENELENASAQIPEEMELKMAAVEKEIKKFEEIKEQKNATIGTLREKLEASEKRAKALENTIAKNIEQQARTEKKLNEENDALRKELEIAIRELENRKLASSRRPRQADADKDEHPIKPKSTLTPIEDILSDTDWVVSPSSLRGGKDDVRNPQREKKNRDKNDSDSQLSLF